MCSHLPVAAARQLPLEDGAVAQWGDKSFSDCFSILSNVSPSPSIYFSLNVRSFLLLKSYDYKFKFPIFRTEFLLDVALLT